MINYFKIITIFKLFYYNQPCPRLSQLTNQILNSDEYKSVNLSNQVSFEISKITVMSRKRD